MKTFVIIILSFMIFLSCAPVLRQDLMKQGTFNVQPSEFKRNPIRYKGRLFIFGGIIVKTTIKENGSLIEAIYVPVNSRGYLKSIGTSDGRFLALYEGKEILDPLIFREKREITLAAEFIELRKGKIGEAEYTYPLFDIKQIYLWAEVDRDDYYRYRYPPWYPPYYPPWYYRHGYPDPWWYY